MPLLFSSLLLVFLSASWLREAQADPDGHPGTWTTLPNNATTGWDVLVNDSLTPNGRGGATHMALLRGGSDSSWVIHWAKGKIARLWLAVPGQSAVMARDVPFQTESLEVFCGAHSVLPDGKLLAVGGTLTEGQNNVGSIGSNRTVTFDARYPLAASNWGWRLQDSMTVERWYGSSTVLGDGRVLASSGKSYELVPVLGGRGSSGLVPDLKLMRRGRHVFWESDTSSGTSPDAREGHSMTFLENVSGYYVVFGGQRGDGSLAPADTIHRLLKHLLDRRDSWEWQVQSVLQDEVNGYPPKRAWHSAVAMGDRSTSGAGWAKAGRWAICGC